MDAMEATVDVVRHLRRLERASCAADIVKELQCLSPSLGQPRLLSGMALPSLAALAEAHLRDRLEPARDALTGLLDARAFNELFMAHARHVSALGTEAVAVCLTLHGTADPRKDRVTATYLRALAAACTACVAEGDYVGRVASTALAVLPRHGGLRGARSVAARLVDTCRQVFASAEHSLRLEVELKDDAGCTQERSEIALGVL
jgi:GGDEF domain-containing protein